MIRRPFYIQLDGEGDQNDILAGLGGQFLFRGGDGAQQILTAVEFGIVIHMYMAHRSSTGLTKEKMSMSGVYRQERVRFRNEDSGLLDTSRCLSCFVSFCPDLDQLSCDGDGDLRRGLRIDVHADGGGDDVQFLFGEPVFFFQHFPDTGGLFL